MPATTTYEPTLSFARQMDERDPLRRFREEYLIPPHQGRESLYFCGNSLGPQPRAAAAYVGRELERWATLGVRGHFTGEPSWMELPKMLTGPAARIVGATEAEVILMNTLTVNLHLMMVSFYRPTRERFRIIMEAGAFPSDQYAVESQVRFHGFDPSAAIVEVAPRAGEATLRTEDIVEVIEQQGAQTALVLFGGINYYSGQLYDLPAITAAAHRAGAYAGFDLAHAAGNVPLRLHDWGADFGIWCTYKYLNSGPGALSGAFIHERHAANRELPRFAGWWGYDEGRRFLMEKGFVPSAGAAGWQLSTPVALALAAMQASHELFDQATMPALRAKSRRLTGYLEFLIDRLRAEGRPFTIITPRDPEARGAQLSLLTGANGRALFEHLSAHGVVCDWREPNVIRLAPAPMYNTFEEVFELAALLRAFAD